MLSRSSEVGGTRFYSSFIRLRDALLRRRGPADPDPLQHQLRPTPREAGQPRRLIPPQILHFFFGFFVQTIPSALSNYFCFQRLFALQRMRTDLENKHKLIPNTLIIGNEHLSYPVRVEPVSCAMRKPTAAKRALNPPVPRASAPFRGAGLGTRCSAPATRTPRRRPLLAAVSFRQAAFPPPAGKKGRAEMPVEPSAGLRACGSWSLRLHSHSMERRLCDC